ncbi:hypothetical protein Acr_08g0009520 [Actinidia rufa]|uniref:Uncharacterized protein n=1 Tax=Actinidia rufa TaxID=165716 RepID=A0A7J0F290_9ERIC|nr:hypothetical protein Acr_08g0009520 [Actinidia rufa]
MSRTSDATRSGDLDSLPSWISDHLGEGSSFMTDEVNQSPSSPMEGSPEESPMIAIHPSVRLPDEGETIISTRPGEVAFYEAAFPVGLRFPLHLTIRLILQFYNICPAQLVPNAWRSITCSMALWRARNKKGLLGGYPNNVKGWKSKFFFVSGDEWEIPEGTSREGAPRVPRTWGIPNKHCNNPPRLYGDEPKVFEEIFQSVEKSGCFSVPVLLDSKSYRRVFVSPGSRASRIAGGNLPSGEAPSNVGESQNPHEQARRESPSRDDSIECLGSIRTELRRLLPHIPDLTLLRWTGGKVLDSILDHFLNAPSSNPSSESCSDSSLPVELESDTMSKRVNFKKIGKKLGKMAGASSGTPVLEKGVVIGEKRAGERASPARPVRRERLTTARRGKELTAGQKAKRRRPHQAKPRPLQPPFLRTLGKGPQLILLAESRAREQQANHELAKMKNDRDSLTDKLERSGLLLVNELREALDKAKESVVEEFKSSSKFMVAVEDSASKYFGEGFDFCKVQLLRHHPDLTIDLEGTVVDQDLLAEQDEAAEEREKENLGENKGCCFSYYFHANGDYELGDENLRP